MGGQTTNSAAAEGALPFSRWWLVVAAAFGMGAAGSYEFVWSSIRGPLGSQVGASEQTLGSLFTLLIVAQTLSQFPAGWVRDRYGPRLPMLVGTVMLAGGYGALSVVATPIATAVAVLVGGSGAGTVYSVTVNTPVKWFSTHRGLATGLVTMAYSGLSVALIPAVRGGIGGTFASTLFALAALVLVACLVGIVVIRDPEEGTSDDSTQEDTTSEANEGISDDSSDGVSEAPSYGWREAMRTWQFWLLYAVFVVINGIGLMLIEKVIAFADGLGLPAAVATGAASTIAFGDGAGVVSGGVVADRLHPTRTVGVALLLGSLAVAGAVVAGGNGYGTVFVLLVGATAFFRSPVFAVFPGLLSDYYGTGHSSENYAVMYTGKLWGSVLGGTATSALIAAIGWGQSFLLAAGLLALAGLAMFAVRPVERTAA
ncbi:MFS transporter [Halolamina salifodinae]|uniref:OFA family oxalate/formate antiporter-like MFS transporter n=1 Tax=Halolamina salifodinae TaxID=1202767 RepID=A0A8T4H2K6_9EURY|nr:MFS transporter [Halolamina salifodinae]MBP1987468.1 OFA family oxalate/formate antiporter-like MFS transporter [Halolamina salifodinae]